MIQLALRWALSDRAARRAGRRGREPGPGRSRAPRTPGRLCRRSGSTGEVLVVLARDDEEAYKSLPQPPEVELVLVGELTAYDMLCSDWIVFTRRARCPGNSA